MPFALKGVEEALMTRHVLICSANDPLVASLRLESGQATFRVTVCRRGMEAVQTS